MIKRFLLNERMIGALLHCIIGLILIYGCLMGIQALSMILYK